MIASATMPPITPPAIVAVFEDDLLPDLDEDPGSETTEVGEEDEPAAPTVEVACPPAPAASVDDGVEAEINEPGITSGVSGEQT
jgi:hypothetical protein